MVELMVVLLIAGILIALGIMAIHGSRATGRTLGAMSVANAYGDAVDRFARDHRGRFPAPPGSVDWPTDGSFGAGRGPSADILGERKFYLVNVPEAVQDGRITFDAGGEARLSYRQLNGGAGYEFVLTVSGRPPCAIRGGTTTGATSPASCGDR